MNHIYRITDVIGFLKRARYRLSRRYNKVKLYANDCLIMNRTKSGAYYYLQWFADGKRERRYLGTDAEEKVKQIKEAKYLKALIGELQSCIEAMEQCAAVLRRCEPAAVNRSLPKTYRLTDGHLKEVLGRTKAEEWREKALKFKREYEAVHGVPYPEELQNRTKDGTMVRSKSELNIYNILLSLGIVFVYELPTEVSGKVIRPDFTIYCEPLDRLIVWEHFGRLFEEKYRLRFANTMDLYLKAGRVPCVNLLMSFDTMDGKLDAKAIDEAVRYLVCGELLAA